jgi:hypothetical protein
MVENLSLFVREDTGIRKTVHKAVSIDTLAHKLFKAAGYIN